MIDLSQRTEFGGKTASLGELTQLGMLVPAGFGVSAHAHSKFRKQAFNQEFKQELSNAFKELGVKRVAVRSSALAEDSREVSWAGQLETYLNVCFNDLEEAIRNCWQSLENDNVKVYLADKNIEQSQQLVGVVVQAMIDSQVSGVMFTADPVDGNRDAIIIESIYGLGELLVQGEITPDRFRYSKQTRQVIDFDVSIKTKEMVYDGQSNCVQSVDSERQDLASLTETQCYN